jgi:protein tyrosine phosphatase (PTP) superfamily phosphohydrolase (DUF442 family)
MKNLPVALTFSFLLIIANIYAQPTPVTGDSVQVVPGFKNLYRYQNFYIGGQPTYEELQWLKNNGVSTTINLRSEKENQEFATASFNEEKIAQQLGYAYFSVPVDGMKDNTPAKLDELATHIPANAPVFIHCLSAGRATNFFMAYLVKYRNYSIDEAIAVGKKLTFSFPLESILDVKITMKGEK